MSTDLPSRRVRRRLELASLDDVLVETQRLARGHQTLGRWTLAQICRHLADTVHGSIDGFDLRNHRIKRRLLRGWLWRYTVRWGIPENYTVDPALSPPAGVGLADELARLEEAVHRYRRHAGPLQAHPLFGVLSRTDWDRLHCLHGAHHLSFVLPVDSPAPHVDPGAVDCQRRGPEKKIGRS